MGAESPVTVRESSRSTGAFDAAAAGYDRSFTDTRLGGWLRDAVWEHMDREFGPGDCVLDLGCGTGADAVRLAHRGARVVGVDGSAEMLEIARSKAVGAGVDACVGFRQLDLADLEGWDPGLSFDGVLANFGVLNCTKEWKGVAGTLAGWVQPGARAVLVLMGPCCPWEIAWHVAHAQFRRAFRRFREGRPAHAGGGGYLPVWYPSPARLKADFAPHFRPLETVGIGALLPPPYLSHLVERRPHVFEPVRTLERRWHGRFPWTWLNDHYLVVMERSGSAVDVGARGAEE